MQCYHTGATLRVLDYQDSAPLICDVYHCPTGLDLTPVWVFVLNQPMERAMFPAKKETYEGVLARERAQGTNYVVHLGVDAVFWKNRDVIIAPDHCVTDMRQDDEDEGDHTDD